MINNKLGAHLGPPSNRSHIYARSFVYYLRKENCPFWGNDHFGHDLFIAKPLRKSKELSHDRTVTSAQNIKSRLQSIYAIVQSTKPSSQ